MKSQLASKTINLGQQQKLTLESSVRRKVKVQTEHGDVEFVTFRHLRDAKEHVALVFKGTSPGEIPLVRIHSECLTGDVFGSAKCDCGEQLQEALKTFSVKGGVLLYLRQEGRGIGLYNKLDAYALQAQGLDTFEANEHLGLPDDLRSYEVAAQMLKALGIKKIDLLSNNPDKEGQLVAYGIEVEHTQSTRVFVKKENRGYLEAKIKKGGHRINLKGAVAPRVRGWL